MKAYMTEPGYLCIEGETPLEDYALSKWTEEWDKGKVVLHIMLPNQNKPSVVSPHLIRNKSNDK